MQRDTKTGEHSLEVACMAREMSCLIPNTIGKEKCFIAGLLHDTGKIKMPDFVFQNYIVKSAADWQIIREHPVHSKEILEKAGFDKEIINACYTHHEKMNGKGYPQRLKGKEIPLEGRMLAIIDSYSAISRDRPYRMGTDLKQAVNILIRDKDIYDLELLSIFIQNINKITTAAKIEAEKHLTKHTEGPRDTSQAIP
jgi:putative nucleotidyltransferase with HDIG domain